MEVKAGFIIERMLGDGPGIPLFELSPVTGDESEVDNNLQKIDQSLHRANLHNDLVEALRVALPYLEALRDHLEATGNDESLHSGAAIKRIEAVLAKAEVING